MILFVIALVVFYSSVTGFIKWLKEEVLISGTRHYDVLSVNSMGWTDFLLGRPMTLQVKDRKTGKDLSVKLDGDNSLYRLLFENSDLIKANKVVIKGKYLKFKNKLIYESHLYVTKSKEVS